MGHSEATGSRLSVMYLHGQSGGTTQNETNACFIYAYFQLSVVIEGLVGAVVERGGLR